MIICCPSCKNSSEIPSSAVGRLIRCGQCNREFRAAADTSHPEMAPSGAIGLVARSKTTAPKPEADEYELAPGGAGRASKADQRLRPPPVYKGRQEKEHKHQANSTGAGLILAAIGGIIVIVFAWALSGNTQGANKQTQDANKQPVAIGQSSSELARHAADLEAKGDKQGAAEYYSRAAEACTNNEQAQQYSMRAYQIRKFSVPLAPPAPKIAVNENHVAAQQKPSRSADDEMVGFREELAASRLKDAKAFAQANPRDPGGYKEKLEGVVSSYKSTPAGQEAVKILAGLKVPETRKPNATDDTEEADFRSAVQLSAVAKSMDERIAALQGFVQNHPTGTNTERIRQKIRLFKRVNKFSMAWVKANECFKKASWYKVNGDTQASALIQQANEAMKKGDDKKARDAFEKASLEYSDLVSMYARTLDADAMAVCVYNQVLMRVSMMSADAGLGLDRSDPELTNSAIIKAQMGLLKEMERLLRSAVDGRTENQFCKPVFDGISILRTELATLAQDDSD